MWISLQKNQCLWNTMIFKSFFFFCGNKTQLGSDGLDRTELVEAALRGKDSENIEFARKKGDFKNKALQPKTTDRKGR